MDETRKRHILSNAADTEDILHIILNDDRVPATEYGEKIPTLDTEGDYEILGIDTDIDERYRDKKGYSITKPMVRIKNNITGKITGIFISDIKSLKKKNPNGGKRRNKKTNKRRNKRRNKKTHKRRK